MKTQAMSRILGAIVLIAAIAAVPASTVDAKTKVDNLDDIPRFAYPIEGSVVDVITSDERFNEFSAKVRADMEGVLAEYEIDDAATLQGYYSVLSRLDLMEGDFDSALRRIEQIRELEEKESGKLVTGLFAKAWVAARAEVDPAADFEAFAAAYAVHLDELVSALPWDVVQDWVKQSKGRAEIFSENMVLGAAKSQVDPAVAASGEVSSDLVRTVVALRYALVMTVPLQQETVDVYGAFIDANKVVKENIWYAREYILGADEGVQPVTIGIWDSGTDVSIFQRQIWKNKRETFDGRDTDRNGFVDDINGIAFTWDGDRSQFLLHPEGDMAGRVDEAMSYTKGFMDLTSSIDSDEASELKRHLSTIEPDQVNDFIEALSFAALHMHGTHVAGIAVEGNPWARILVARLTFDYHNPPAPLTVEIARKLAASFRDAISYFSQNNVRVVNMSWGWSLKEVESMLEANGVGETPEERAELTREIFDIMSDALHAAMADAKNILFVTSAGNSDNDVEFDQMIPSAYRLPNLVVVGAVDQAGDPTGFTSQGEHVKLYANGFEVESYVPGGSKMAASGTSMSSPQVVNLAGKIIAVEPRMTPPEVIALIMEGATPRDGDESFLLLNPKDTMNRLEPKAKPKTKKVESMGDKALVSVD